MSFKFKRYFKRYIQINRILFKYGFEGFFRNFHPAFILARLSKRGKFEAIGFPQRVRMALEELGPTFIKIGQIAASRTDILPEEYTEELSKLQDEVKPVDFREMEKIINREIGDIKKVFEDFNKEPIGSASIAQVYLAKYKGEDVIVKVRRPHIEEIVNVDLGILKILFSILERNIPLLKGKKLNKVIETFERTLLKELDFNIEANNAERFRELFKKDKNIYIPKIYREITTKEVLVQEYVDGIKIDDIEKMKGKNIDLKKVAESGAELYLKQILIFGFFHADPHPGNIFVREGNVIIPIDYGMVGRISSEMRRNIQEFIIGMSERDSERIVRALLRIGLFEGEIDKDSLKEDILFIVDKFEGRRLKEISLRDFIVDIMKVIRKYNVRMPEELLYLGKALSQIESIGKKLYPEFNTVEFIRRFSKEHKLAFLSIKDSMKEKKWFFIDMFNTITSIPEIVMRVDETMRKFLERKEEKNLKSIERIVSCFGILILSMFLFIVSENYLKVISITGIIFSFFIFFREIFKR
uniref:AarF/ABC1/UbiB kinase family protein n=1 Tax=candidate division WOR-3 bacterium TaxID=2052148 RepID=A0A7C4Y568_UNCW3